MWATPALAVASIFRDVLPSGTRLLNGTYELHHPLGQGGFGITYRATHLHLDQPVAIKEFFPKDWVARDPLTGHVRVLPAEQALYQRWLGRFMREAEGGD